MTKVPSNLDDPFACDEAIPKFCRLTTEERAAAWKGRKLTKPDGGTKTDYSVPRSLDAVGKALLKAKSNTQIKQLKALKKVQMERVEALKRSKHGH